MENMERLGSSPKVSAMLKYRRESSDLLLVKESRRNLHHIYLI